VFRALRELRASERGFALPVTIVVVFIGLGLAAVPVLASINAQHGDSHNQGSNQALAAAEAGANLALLRQSQLVASTTTAKPCVGLNGTTLEAKEMIASGAEASWCAPVTLTASSSPAPPTGTEVVYRVMPCFHQTGANSGCSSLVSCETTAKPYSETTENLVKVVSEGKATVGGGTITARVAVSSCSKQETTTTKKETETPAPNIFAGGQVVGIESLTMSNDAQVHHGGAGSNGPVSLEGSANVCGTVKYGTTIKATNGSENGPGNCGSEPRTLVKGTTEFPLVTIPAEVETTNGDSTLSNVSNTVAWNASNKSLVVQNGGTLTLTSNTPYLLCSFEVTGGGVLRAAEGVKVRIYFEPPSKCAGLNGNPQLRIWNGGHVYADSGNGPVFLLVGSTGTPASVVELQGGSNNDQMVIYAPQSTVNVANGITMNGVLVGRTLNLAGGADINERGVFTPPSSSEIMPAQKTTTTTTTTTPKSFTRQAYVQCSASGTLATGC
jgi:hypothetical protein